MKKKIPLWLTALLCIILGVVFGFFILPKIIGIVIPWGLNELALLLTLLGVIAALSVPCISEFFDRKREKRLEKKETEREKRLEEKETEREKRLEEKEAEREKRLEEKEAEREKRLEEKEAEREKRQDAREASRETSTYVIDIHVKTLENNFVLFSASIQNVGDKQIETQIANLYIDQGVSTVLVNDRNGDDVGVIYYAFPFILEHKEEIDGRPDCILCKKCYREHDESYPETVVNAVYKGGDGSEKLLRTHYPLHHLSSKSIKYINPKEKFSEDVIVQFKNAGVYRVTLFVGAKGTADCACATKQFYIPQSLSDDSTQHSVIQTR